MLQLIRIGKDISIEWSILTNGIAIPLEGRNLVLELTTPVLKKIILPINIAQNTILAKFPAKEQKALGVYSLTLWENLGMEEQTCVDKCKAFKLVSRTCEEPSCEIENNNCVTLCGNLYAGVRGESAYEIALRHGFIGSEEEWLKSLGYNKEITNHPIKDAIHIELTPEQKIELQRPASQAAQSLSYLAKKIICIIESSEKVIGDVVNFGSRLENVENKIFPIEFHVYGSGVYEKGTNTDIVLSWELSNGKEIITPEIVTINNIPVEGNSKIFKNVTSDKEYVVSAIYNNNQYTKIAKVVFCLPVRYGFSSFQSAAKLSVDSLNKIDVNETLFKDYILDNPVTGNYLWFLLPENINIEKVYSSGIIFPFENYETITYNGLIYKCYRSTSSINEGQINVNLIWEKE